MVTTCTAVYGLPPTVLSKANLVQVLKVQQENLQLLRANGVVLAIGSDMVNDSSVEEAEYLQKLGIFDNLTLLKMWAETTPRTIFPKRKIGQLQEGFEASFLALAGNPLMDWTNVRKIKVRFKQGNLLAP
ncbi:hypothetical protein ACFSUS_25715 [Spirosoma soli]|uniref:Amidohydrolase family protein n=1 Tax=Spirosoma soli TaxID=1770529 RepID=A0ABW5MAH4_9BACT